MTPGQQDKQRREDAMDDDPEQECVQQDVQPNSREGNGGKQEYKKDT